MMNILSFDSILFSYKRKEGNGFLDNHQDQPENREHENRVLSDVYGYVKTNEILGIVGLNGCGKTTLFKCICGLMYNDKGIVTINHRVIKKRDRWKFIGYLSQESFLPKDLRVRQVAGLFLDSEKSASLLEDWKIQNFADKRTNSLSLGNRRYLEVSILLSLERPFLLLDEPFTHLEGKYVEDISRRILEHRNRAGFIISDHNYRDVRHICTRLILMEHGTVKEVENSEHALSEAGYLPPEKQ
jgi:ABC-type multidrug transport system ATPase subunit